jgi:ATP-dependent RNA circularization protein (DNA/RNA ligase family)
MKPLGQKAYGSIPHLPGSRLGPGDYCIHEGQAKIATEKPRDRHDVIIVQEKLDGSNVAIAKVNDEIVALTRAGYLANTSPYLQHHIFAEWVNKNKQTFVELLNEGERLCGEWLAMAHGTRYNLHHEPFVAFDLMTGTKRRTYLDFKNRVTLFALPIPHLIHFGSSFSIEQMIEAIKTSGHGAIDEVEGAIWRVERKGEVDFLTKYVHHHKQDGKYFAEYNNGNHTWNIDIEPYKHLLEAV